MTYKFKNIIIRKPNRSIHKGLSSQNINPVFEKVLEEHNNYVKIMNALDLNVNLLEPLENFPDSIFIEDPAIIYKSSCIILNPSDPSRNGEKKIISEEIKKFFDDLIFIENGFVEGGDILNIFDHFVIGVSQRTTKIGAESLKNILISLGATVSICETPKNVLHFKSECSLIDGDIILVSSNMAKLEYLKSNYKLVELPIGEEGAANSLRINNKLVVPDGFSKAEEILSKNFDIIKIKVNEISKVDAGLSCMSLRW